MWASFERSIRSFVSWFIYLVIYITGKGSGYMPNHSKILFHYDSNFLQFLQQSLAVAP